MRHELETERFYLARFYSEAVEAAGGVPLHISLIPDESYLEDVVGRLDAAKTRSATVRNVFSRYADCMLAQIFQSTACNAIHSIEQRTAKWIIAAMERTDDDEILPLTHEQLATLLGVGTQLSTAIIVVLGIRIFGNAAALRRRLFGA